MGFAVEPRSQLSFEVTYLDMGWCKVKSHGWEFTNHTQTHIHTHIRSYCYAKIWWALQ